MSNTKLNVKDSSTLLVFLQEKMGGMSRTSLKQMLSQRRVMVDGHVETNFACPLDAGSVVEIVHGRPSYELKHPKLRVVYEDEHLIVVEKREGLLTVATYPGSTETTVFSILKNYVRQSNPRGGVFTVHRLDRETSGLLVFAKSKELQEYMREWWRDIVKCRTYIAVAEGLFDKKEGRIVTWLTEDKRNAVVYSSPTDDGGKKSITNYKVVKEKAGERDTDIGLSLVELNLETGRTNQIRVHLASIGHPIAGDRKYGSGTQLPIDRLALHARVLEFIHPVTEKVMHFETPIPKEFIRLMK
ncbi:MAG: RluA family pseudouridine synthase [Paludibacteraceae bacterium]|nr:RluA family pseudouridine synthase [Paludibacteraceae bacterium]